MDTLSPIEAQQNTGKLCTIIAMPSNSDDRLLINTPAMKTGRLPNRAISNEAGKVTIITLTNCSDSGKVASHGAGARI